MKSFLPIILVLITVCFASCDGRNRIHQTPKEVLQESKLLDSFSESVTYFPESYSEVVIDTLLSNGKSVKIKSFTDMESSVLNTFKSDTIYFKHFYRDFKAEITITNKSKKTIRFDIDKAFIKKHDTLYENNKSFYNEAIIKSVMLSDFDSIVSDNTVINISLCKPKSDTCKVFKLFIEDNGTLKLKELEID